MVRAATNKSQYRWFSITTQLSNTVFAPQYFNDIIDFAKGQVELGNNLHVQWIVHTKKKITISGLSKFIYGHIEGARNVPKLYEYVWKDDDTTVGCKFEYGSAPINRNSATDWAVVRQAAISQQWTAIPDDIMVRFAGSLKCIAGLMPEAPPFRDDIRVFYYWGDSGSGKTHAAFEESGYKDDPSSVYYKGSSTKWFDGYQGQSKSILDDFEGDIALVHLKRWFDKYPCTVEVKGSTFPLKVTTFWVTSNKSPDEILDIIGGRRAVNTQDRLAFKRRLTVKHFTTLGM